MRRIEVRKPPPKCIQAWAWVVIQERKVENVMDHHVKGHEH